MTLEELKKIVADCHKTRIALERQLEAVYQKYDDARKQYKEEHLPVQPGTLAWITTQKPGCAQHRALVYVKSLALAEDFRIIPIAYKVKKVERNGEIYCYVVKSRSTNGFCDVNQNYRFKFEDFIKVEPSTKKLATCDDCIWLDVKPSRVSKSVKSIGCSILIGDGHRKPNTTACCHYCDWPTALAMRYKNRREYLLTTDYANSGEGICPEDTWDIDLKKELEAKQK
jgi:hypothetical protein